VDPVRAIADAVLYEGYVLWPYRRSAIKNQKRWTFGGVYPPRHSERHADDPCVLRTQCLLEAGDAIELDVRVRFLQVVERRLVTSDGTSVDELTVSGTRYLAWDEATERDVEARLGRTEIDVRAGTAVEPLPEEAGRIVRSWEGVRGCVDVELEPLRERLFRLTVRIENTTPWDGDDRDDALRRTFCSTHCILRADGGAFVSPTDPPEELRDEAAACDNAGLWPVLVGDDGERHAMLAAPIILPDYPRVAPESPGDLFDATEVDKLLILNVLSLTEEEQQEMRDTDPRAKEILDRCASLSPEQLMRLHGALRDVRRVGGE
jgi:hypothetical protein